MFKYAIALKPVVLAGGIDGLTEDKRKAFEGMVFFMAKLIECAQEVESVEIRPDFSLIVSAKEEVEQLLKKIGDNAIVRRLENTVVPQPE